METQRLKSWLALNNTNVNPVEKSLQSFSVYIILQKKKKMTAFKPVTIIVSCSESMVPGTVIS